MVVAEVPKLESAAEYFFKVGAEGKRFRPTVLLLMASALKFPIPESTDVGVFSILASKLRTRQQNIAEITEMIHVASLLHDDVLDDADTRRGVTSLNCIMGNKLSVLAGDFLLSRACVALAALGNTEVVSLMATAVGHLVTGETMQMSTSREQRRSMEYYLQKTYYKTASLISNSCKAVAILAGHTAEVSVLAYEYGRNLEPLLHLGRVHYLIFVMESLLLQCYMRWKNSHNYKMSLTRVLTILQMLRSPWTTSRRAGESKEQKSLRKNTLTLRSKPSNLSQTATMKMF
ncbi:unnamed protein product [Triticum turgidum subsp. durum]|uniref:Uncharacterized protein n=1 Tax=Triticum turgidum subsp. durum TaxID=4567 RepID=A0A9R0ZMP6_TRITD|nr:unnamed protein product [Triticum turgidum subsp. durum]